MHTNLNTQVLSLQTQINKLPLLRFYKFFQQSMICETKELL